MQIAFWIVSGLLALAYVAAGSMKALKQKDAIVASGMAWAENFAPATIKLIGIAEVLGGLGLVLPVLTGIVPILSPIAAACLLVIMIGAVVVHARRKESATPSIVLAVLTPVSMVLGFVAVLVRCRRGSRRFGTLRTWHARFLRRSSGRSSRCQRRRTQTATHS